MNKGADKRLRDFHNQVVAAVKQFSELSWAAIERDAGHRKERKMETITRFDMENQVIQRRIADQLKRIADSLEKLAKQGEQPREVFVNEQ